MDLDIFKDIIILKNNGGYNLTEENINDLTGALMGMGATIKKDGKHIQATFTSSSIKVRLEKDNLVICSDNALMDPSVYNYKIFGNTGNVGIDNGKRIITLSPSDFQ